MKSYRFLVLGALVLLVGAGWFSLARAGAGLQQARADHLAAARAAVAIGAIQEGQREFRAALEIEPDVEVYDELLAFLGADAPRDLYVAELERYVTAYPDRAEGYERLATAYADGADEARAYETVLRARSRDVGSATLDEIFARVAYVYTIGVQPYDEVLPYGRSDVAAVRDGSDRWVHVDAAGVSLNGRYDAVGPLWEGTRFVVADGLPQFVDTAGRQVLAATRAGYEEYGILTDGVFAARASDGSWTFLDEGFRPALGDVTFDEVTSFAGGLAATRTGETWQVVRRDGTVVGEGYADVAVDAEGVLVSQGRYFAKVGDAFGLFATDGERVGEGVYEDARPFDVAGAAAVKVGGLWGFVDPSGKIVVEPAYEDARSFANGVAPVRTGGAWGYVDASGTMIIAPTFLDATRFTSTGTALVLTDEAPRHPSLTDGPATATQPPAATAPTTGSTATTPDATDATAPATDAATPTSDVATPTTDVATPTTDATKTQVAPGTTETPGAAPAPGTTTPGTTPGDDTGWRQIKLLRYSR